MRFTEEQTRRLVRARMKADNTQQFLSMVGDADPVRLSLARSMAFHHLLTELSAVLDEAAKEQVERERLLLVGAMP